MVFLVRALVVFWALTGATVSSFAQESDAAEKQKTDAAQMAEKQEFKLPDGLKWESNNEDPIYADPRAQKGGVYKGALLDFPPTLRQVGPNSNSGFRGHLDNNDLALLERHPNTGNYIPSLATHWAVAPDNKTVYYKLDLRARWSDGKPVTAEDYLFTIEFMRSPHIVAPWYNNYYTEEITEVIKHSDDVISVVSGKEHIKLFLLSRTSIAPTPKHFYKLDKNWVNNYNWKLKPNTGAYNIKRFKHGKFVEFERKKDWWAKDLKYHKYRYNVDTMQYKVIRDTEARWQAFLRGDLTLHIADLANYWYDKAQGEAFDKGYIKKIWFYHQKPNSGAGLWLNMQKEIWKDVNVRVAFAHALNFAKVNKEVLRGEQKRLQAFNEGYEDYSDPSLKARTFDINQVGEYMKKSGWSMGKSGFWEKAGKPIEVAISYGQDRYKDQLVVLQEEAKKAGFNITLDFLDWTAFYKKTFEKNHQVAWVDFNNSSFPPPRYWEYLHSENAKSQTNNLTMISDSELDQMITKYRETFDEKEKMALSRKILKRHYQLADFVPRNYPNFWRLLYWKSWNFPKVAGTRFLDRANTSVMWFDPKAEQELKEAKKAGKSFGKWVKVDTTYK